MLFGRHEDRDGRTDDVRIYLKEAGSIDSPYGEQARRCQQYPNADRGDAGEDEQLGVNIEASQPLPIMLGEEVCNLRT